MRHGQRAVRGAVHARTEAAGTLAGAGRVCVHHCCRQPAARGWSVQHLQARTAGPVPCQGPPVGAPSPPSLLSSTHQRPPGRPAPQSPPPGKSPGLAGGREAGSIDGAGLGGSTGQPCSPASKLLGSRVSSRALHYVRSCQGVDARCTHATRRVSPVAMPFFLRSASRSSSALRFAASFSRIQTAKVCGAAGAGPGWRREASGHAGPAAEGAYLRAVGPHVSPRSCAPGQGWQAAGGGWCGYRPAGRLPARGAPPL